MTSRDLMHGLTKALVEHGQELRPVTTYDPETKLFTTDFGGIAGVIRPRARSTDPETSHAAADSMQSHASVQRQQILDCAAKEARPLTADDFDRLLGFRPSTSGRRLGELCSFRVDFVMVYLDGGLDPQEPSVRVPKVEGLTRSGRKAYAYILRSLLPLAGS